jgi:hypothetical protein
MIRAEETPTVNDRLDPGLHSLLSTLRRSIRRYARHETLLVLVAICLASFWGIWLIDYVPTRWGAMEMPRSARLAALVIVGVVIAAAVWRYYLRRRLRRLPDDSLALLLERSHPHLGGRLVSAVQLMRPSTATSKSQAEAIDPKLLEQLHREAIESSRTVDVRRVFRWRPLQWKLAAIAPMLLGVAVMAISQPLMLKQSFERMMLLTDANWPRRAKLEMVGLEVAAFSWQEGGEVAAGSIVPFREGVARLARGQAAVLRVQAAAEEAVVPEQCTVRYRSFDGVRGEANMRRVGRVRDGYQAFALDGPPLDAIQSDTELSIRGLDARLDGFRIEVVDPPTVQSVDLEVQLPPYLAIGEDRQRLLAYRPGVRVPEGSELKLIGRSSKPLSAVRWRVIEEGSEPRVDSMSLEGGVASFAIPIGVVGQSLSVEVVPIDAEGIAALRSERLLVTMLRDESPKIELQLQGVGSAITAKARLPISGKATDDYALRERSLLLVPDAKQPDLVKRWDLNVQADGVIEQVIDLQQLSANGELEVPLAGTQLSVLAEVTDDYDLRGQHRVRSSALLRDVVSEDELLGILQKKELLLRSRVEQMIDEQRQLRGMLERIERELPADAALRARGPSDRMAQGLRVVGGARRWWFTAVVLDQPPEANPEAASPSPVVADEPLQRSRIQQALLQSEKGAQELAGLAVAIDDIVAEMVNNRLDTADRMERLQGRVRQPIGSLQEGPMTQVQRQLSEAYRTNGAARKTQIQQAIASAELCQQGLQQILESMLDMEDYNELLDQLRGMIEEQKRLTDETKDQQKRDVLDLFE